MLPLLKNFVFCTTLTYNCLRYAEGLKKRAKLGFECIFSFHKCIQSEHFYCIKKTDHAVVKIS